MPYSDFGAEAPQQISIIPNIKLQDLDGPKAKLPNSEDAKAKLQNSDDSKAKLRHCDDPKANLQDSDYDALTAHTQNPMEYIYSSPDALLKTSAKYDQLTDLDKKKGGFPKFWSSFYSFINILLLQGGRKEVDGPYSAPTSLLQTDGVYSPPDCLLPTGVYLFFFFHI